MDRHTDDPACFPLLGNVGAHSVAPAVILYARGPVRREDQRVYASVLVLQPGAGRQRSGPGARPPRANDRRRAVFLVPAHDREVGIQEPRRLSGDRGKHLLWRRRPGHKHRYPAERGPFVGEPRACGPLQREKARVGEGHTGLMRQRADERSLVLGRLLRRSDDKVS